MFKWQAKINQLIALFIALHWECTWKCMWKRIGIGAKCKKRKTTRNVTLMSFERVSEWALKVKKLLEDCIQFLTKI